MFLLPLEVFTKGCYCNLNKKTKFCDYIYSGTLVNLQINHNCFIFQLTVVHWEECGSASVDGIMSQRVVTTLEFLKSLA